MSNIPGLKFGMFYVADFLHAFTIAFLFAVLLLGGWQGPGAEKYPLLGIFYIALQSLVLFTSPSSGCALVCRASASTR